MAGKNVLFVVGSGRSGTSLFAQTFQELGCLVPQPEVETDGTNPKGFGESQWVVDFHQEMMQSSGVVMSDSRPDAFFHSAKACFERTYRSHALRFLRSQLRQSDHVLIKDPRLLWFLPLWQDCAVACGAKTSYVTLLRNPADVVSSKERSYSRDQPSTSRAAGWVNTMLYTERSTRDKNRVFVLFDDLLADWTKTSGQVCDELGLDLVRDAKDPQLRRAAALADPSLRRSKGTWSSLGVWEPVADLADTAWGALLELTKSGADEGTLGRLDDVRERYLELYSTLEAATWATHRAAKQLGQREGRARVRIVQRLAAKIPKRVRVIVPASVRDRLLGRS